MQGAILREHHLVCGKPDCIEIATTLFLFDWTDGNWSGVLGACGEHREDLAVVCIDQAAAKRNAAGERE